MFFFFWKFIVSIFRWIWTNIELKTVLNEKLYVYNYVRDVLMRIWKKWLKTFLWIKRLNRWISNS